MENYEELPISVEQNDDNTFTIEWDGEDPRTCQFNHWTEEDFQSAIRKGLQEEILDRQDREFTTQDFVDNFDELFERVENGETLTILHETGQRVLIMPINQLPHV